MRKFNFIDEYGFDFNDITTENEIKHTNFLKWEPIDVDKGKIKSDGDVLFGIKNNENVAVHVIINLRDEFKETNQHLFYFSETIHPGETCYLDYPIITILSNQQSPAFYLVKKLDTLMTKWFSSLLHVFQPEPTKINFLVGYIQDTKNDTLLSLSDLYRTNFCFYNKRRDQIYWVHKLQIHDWLWSLGWWNESLFLNDPFWDEYTSEINPKCYNTSAQMFQDFKEHHQEGSEQITRTTWVELDLHTYESCHFVLK